MLDPNTQLLLVSVGKGVVYGAIAGGIGYIKNEDWETFDPYKFTRTLVIGAIIGGITGTGHSLTDASVIIGDEFGIPPVMVETFLMTAIVAIADNVAKILARRTDLGLLWNKIKEFFGKRL